MEDKTWRKTGDFKIDCDDKKAILLLNIENPKQENLEEVIIHELMHIKMYPLDQVTESLITSNFEPIKVLVLFSCHGSPCKGAASFHDPRTTFDRPCTV